MDQNNHDIKIVDGQIKDNAVTILLKHEGKIYATGADIGNIVPGMPDEDIDSTLRGVRGLCLNLLRTIAVTLAGKPEDYPIPLTDLEEENETAPEELIMLAAEDIKEGQPVIVDTKTGRARVATEDDGVSSASDV